MYNALVSGDQRLGFGNGKARAFDEEVSPFASFEDGYTEGFNDLFDLLPAGRYILYATPVHIETPANWKLIEKVEGVQMIFKGNKDRFPVRADLVPLNKTHVDEMVKLAQLTKPGPFGTRTIEFGHYFGIFDNNKLVAMAGQRMHVHDFTEISAVCTHPDHVGKGYASELVKHQVNLIIEEGKTPFLHVRADNTGAIRVYERLGFVINRPMNFYFMQRGGERRKEKGDSR